ncbi:MAG: hypothetical protein M1828_006178 [Chrysothrix sp. TS-e1954]|nr:MAG: hypothetical protein M1828_006178 [Chrysothrix sp. TS-e1954]
MATDTFTLSAPTQKFDDFSTLSPHVEPLTSSSAPTSIKHISLSGNTLGVPAAESLASHLSKLAALESANLADLFTGRLLHEIPPALEALLSALLDCKKLHTINLSDNAFGRNTAEPLVRFLEKHTPLRHLILNNNGLGPEAGTLVADALVRLAEQKQKTEQPMLETVVCGRNRLETGSMSGWAKAYVAHKDSIRSVKMVQNGIRPDGIQVLLRQGLGECKRLRLVDLQDNTFTSSGIAALAEVIPNWTELEDLGVSDCLIGNRAFEKLADTLAAGHNRDLQTLRCTYGEVEAGGVRRLVEVMKKGALDKLTRVELNGNRFSEEDPAIEELQQIMRERDGGLDDLSDLEEMSDEDDEDDGSDADDDDDEEDGDKDRQREEEGVMKQTEQAEQQNVPQEKDEEVDELAEKLGKTGI